MALAGAGRGQAAPVSERLFAEAYRFDFFQAVRLLEEIARELAATEGADSWKAVGHGELPQREVVRFRALPSLTFPAGPISQLKRTCSPEAPQRTQPLAEMQVAFMGLTGPSGVLPQHYTSLVIERCHVAYKDTTLRDFFDLFNHRTISLFYRAWEKYRYQFTTERAHRTGQDSAEDFFTFCLRCLTGLGTDGLAHRMGARDSTVLYYSGHFSHHPRSAVGLEQTLADHFGLPARIEQFWGRWLYLPEEVQSAMPTPRQPQGLNCELGRNVIVGRKVWEIQSKFRVCLGPLSYSEFLRLIPAGDALRPLWDLVRLYVGLELTFEVQVILRASEVPACRLGGAPGSGSRLGWNTWLTSQPVQHDVGDAVFRLEEA